MQYIRNLMFTKNSRLGIAAIAVLFMCGQSLGAIHIHVDHHDKQHIVESAEHTTENSLHSPVDSESGSEYSTEDGCSFCIQADKTPSVLAVQPDYVDGFASSSIAFHYLYQANSKHHFSAFQSRAPPIAQ